ncbi:F-box only protein 16 [Solea senegalensis]|uniref:F-box only protein 16 n=1 Tax=Solea senegalensis TaxID=28829 RepID=A0AAV6RY07_SOLSE|nr:F-box only protein 16 [Solea senegalensis]
MPHPPRSANNCGKMQTKLSAWTPLNHPVANGKIFEERRTLLAKWFDRWSDSQRRAVLQDFVLSCSPGQLKFLSLIVSRRLPLQAADFTCLLPRALCLYIFSFLDPRSLCRCAQVSWHWKNIVELDQLWMPKCLRFSWCISFSPSPLQQSVKIIIQKKQMFQCTNAQNVQNSLIHLQSATSMQLVIPKVKRKAKQQSALPPWRDSDRRPKDTLRFNYLDNLSPIKQALETHMKSPALTCRHNTSQPDVESKKSPSDATYKLRKAKSLMFLSSNYRPQHPPLPPHHHDAQTQPEQASCGNSHPVTKETTRSLLCLAQWNAGVRPGPVRSAVPQLSVEALRVWKRSQRSSPSSPLFEV